MGVCGYGSDGISIQVLGAGAGSQEGQGVRHPFQAILRLTLLGLVCGQTTMAHIALFARMPLAGTEGASGLRISDALNPRHDVEELSQRTVAFPKFLHNIVALVLEHLAVIIVSHYDADMRTTLTIDDDIADALRERARLLDLPFKQVVNDALRRGMSPGTREAPIVKR